MIEIEKLVKQLRHCAGYAAYYDGDYNGIYNQAAEVTLNEIIGGGE